MTNRLSFFRLCAVFAAWLGAGAAAHGQAGNLSWGSASSSIFNAPKDGQVLGNTAREKLIQADARWLNRANAPLWESLQKVENPYYLKLAPPPSATSGNESTTSAPAPVVPQVTDADKLKQVAEQLKATGRFVVGGRALLSVPPNQTLPVGQSLEVTFPGEAAPSRILLVSVEVGGYTLKLNDTVALFPYTARPASSRPATTPSTSAGPAPAPAETGPAAGPSPAPAVGPAPVPAVGPAPAK